MTNKLRRWIRNWLTQEENYGIGISVAQTDNYPRDSVGNEDSIKFTVTPANGGVLITTYSYNAKKGDNNTNLYIVHQDDEIAENITKIITLELLKKQ